MNNAFETVFKTENVALLFGTESHSGNFIAEADDRFSDYMDRRSFGLEWSRSFPAGRYVIVIYQRCSVYIAGKQIWQNNDFLNEVGKDSRYRSPRFVIALDRARDYAISSWDQPLQSHIVHDADAPLQVKTFSCIEAAETVALKYSEQGFKAAVLEWFEDFDMF